MINKNNDEYIVTVSEELLLEIGNAIGTQLYEGIEISMELKKLKKKIDKIEWDLDKIKYGD